jgi:hypothetical protein
MDKPCHYCCGNNFSQRETPKSFSFLIPVYATGSFPRNVINLIRQSVLSLLVLDNWITWLTLYGIKALIFCEVLQYYW